MNKTQETTPFAGHTPGPWRTCSNIDGKGIYIQTETPLWVNGVKWTRVDPGKLCATGFLVVGSSRPEIEANARLIAAAPALLASHEALYSALADVMAEADFGDAELSRKCSAALSDARKVMEGGAK